MTSFYHVTLLSNWALAFDKYSQSYNKAFIPKSHYPKVFFVLPHDQLEIGIKKASGFLKKSNKKGDCLIIIETQLDNKAVKANQITPTGLGYYIEQTWIKVSELYYYQNNTRQAVRIEEAMAASYALNGVTKTDYKTLKPRTISILPIAKGCQAKCAFCFSAASISDEKRKKELTEQKVLSTLEKAQQAGAIRAVITGGGEPGLVPLKDLLLLLQQCHSFFKEVILISNGYFLVQNPDILEKLIQAGLSKLSISRHHFDRKTNAKLMGLDIDSEPLALLSQQLSQQYSHFFLRWVCVLQKGGIDSSILLQNYIDWAFNHQVKQICFKELYVSSSSESLYFDAKANDWSYQNQVSLSLITEYAKQQNWRLLFKLPWGSPVYEITKGNQTMTIAAYTEPSVSWELANKTCRSWNLLADGRCYASLETTESEL